MKGLKNKILYIFHNVFFPNQLAFGVFFLNLFGDKNYCRNLKVVLKRCPQGSFGHRLLDFMEEHGFDFVPWYEKHDMKHVLLGYGATAPEEMYMQAFMFGNAGFKPLVTIITLTFLIWTPDAWKDLPFHFMVGRMSKPIGNLVLEDIAESDLEELRNEIGLYEARRKAAMIYSELFLSFPLK